MKAHLRQVRLAPKKTNLVAAMIRRMSVVDALSNLQKLPKKGALILYKVVYSAMANAEQNDGQKRKDLYIKELIVNRGPAYQRAIPMARGRSRPIDKFTSHITVKLGVIVPAGKKEKEVKKQKSSEKKPLEAEIVAGPIAQAPGNPTKRDAQNDDASAGTQDIRDANTFSTFRHNSRGE